MWGMVTRGRRPGPCLLLALLAGQAVGAKAQQPVPLKGRIEPYLGSLGRDYPVIGVAARFRHRADSTARTAYVHETHLAVGATFKGGIKAQAHFRSPALHPGYRLAAGFAMTRKARTFFPGLGNDTEFDRSFEKDAHPDYYSVRRNRLTVRIEGTRWLGAGFGIAVGLGLDEARFTAMPAETVFRDSYGASLAETDVNAGLVVLYDRRNSEVRATRGVLLEAGGQLGAGAGRYHRVFALAQGYLPLARGTVAAGRAVIAGLGGSPPLIARFEIPLWERSFVVFGGDDSHRGLPGNRLLGSGAWLLNVELRQDLGAVRGQTVSVIGLVDAGRVFETEPVSLSSDGTKLSAGVALALRGRRERLGAGLAALGPDGLRLSLVSGWPF